ncbi:DUF3291 domain-containing protein [Calothrix sp. NIES-3974]|uniref:DUF3291 domain-containing protein n=1 Tax=Calothrix sp. NIES-3974 TaxID=2005462 RepID=UPI000B5FFCF7|nr:DUF3291 domain-containing protein [Calothrix sp. NIES-3974]BAZ07488.1 hypothetical protein NIES3974_41510 [Calothrix sp. NIES-3974]
MVFISVTRLRLRAWRFLPAFLWLSFASERQAKQALGNIKTKLVADANFTFWTLTMWENEAAMRAFMTTGSHRQAMPKLVEWCDEATVVHWEQEREEFPTMAEAYQRMQKQGRWSKLNHPSVAHQNREIAMPKS